MTDLEYAAQKYAIDHYGDLIVPDKPIFHDKTKTWEVQLRSTYPRIVQDDKSQEVVVRFLDFRDLGTIRMNENLDIVDATPTENCEHQLMSRIELWKQQSEQIVLKASSDVFAKIAESTHVLYPLVLILDKLTKHKDVFTISEEEVDEQRRHEKIRKYLELLEQLEIVKKIDSGYTYGNKYVGLAERVDEPRQLKTVLLAHVIRQKYTTLRQVFGIAQLEPYVRLANAYYWPSLDAGKLIRTARQNLFRRYQDYYYPHLSSWDFDARLSDLIDQGEIVEENGYLVGDRDRFDEMLQMKNVSMQLNP